MNAEVILAGRPNSGKSTLFNRLASANQKVANYAGCTVEKKTSIVRNADGISYELTDLPGLYSLKPNSLDEEVALRYLDEKKQNSLVVFVCDGNNLEQELVLPLMLKKQGTSIAIAVNMMDEVRANKKILNLAGMTDLAGIPFFPLSAKTGEGVDGLQHYLQHAQKNIISNTKNDLLGLENDVLEKLHREARVTARKVHEANPKTSITNNYLLNRDRVLDKVLLHKIGGPITFFITMFIVFQSIFTWAEPLTGLIEEFFQVASTLAKNYITNELLASFISDGLIAGIGAVLVFLPQISILFLLIGLLEYSGYLPRIAYMVDRMMKPYGLDGKVFIPLLSSVACAVPGIMATRTIENERTRLITIMISPLMTCSARLPVYTLLIAAFIPQTKVWGMSLPGIVMFVLYVFAVVIALLVALFLHKMYFRKNKQSIDLIHLPHYRMPDWNSLFKFVWTRIYLFLRKAGTIIAVMAMLLWALLSFPKDHNFEKMQQEKITATKEMQTLSDEQKVETIAKLQNEIDAQNLAYSFGGRMGKTLEPLFLPIGYDWKLTIGILSSLAAREVFVSTIGTVFALGNGEEHEDGLIKTLQESKKADGSNAYTLATCLSLLAFFAFSLQCTSTIGIAKKETNSWKIPGIMFVYMFVLAYGSAFFMYRIGLLL